MVLAEGITLHVGGRVYRAGDEIPAEYEKYVSQKPKPAPSPAPDPNAKAQAPKSETRPTVSD